MELFIILGVIAAPFLVYAIDQLREKRRWEKRNAMMRQLYGVARDTPIEHDEEYVRNLRQYNDDHILRTAQDANIPAPTPAPEPVVQAARTGSGWTFSGVAGISGYVGMSGYSGTRGEPYPRVSGVSGYHGTPTPDRDGVDVQQEKKEEPPKPPARHVVFWEEENKPPKPVPPSLITHY